jgi:hypothetical protein
LFHKTGQQLEKFIKKNGFDEVTQLKNFFEPTNKEKQNGIVMIKNIK